MLTLKFYAGADDAPARLPVRVLPGVTDVRLSDEKPPRLVYSLPSPGLVSRGRDDVSYLPLTDLGPVEVFNAAGVSLAVLNNGPEAPPLFVVDTLSPDQRRRMQGYDPGPGPRMRDEPCRWPVALTPPGVIDTVGGYPALALALQKEGYSFGSLTEGFGWWFGKWTDAAENGSCGAAETLRQAILGAEEHYRDAAERTPGDVGAAMRTRAGTILDRARQADGLEQHKPLRARRIPLDLARAGDQAATVTLHADDGTSALKVEGGNAVFTGGVTAGRRIFPPVPAEDWLSVDLYPSDLLGRGERLAVMVEDDAGNVGRAFRGADGTWWVDLPADATPEQLDFDPVRFSHLPAQHRFACRTCFAWLGLHHVDNCPNAPGEGPHLVIASDTPPAERARRIALIVSPNEPLELPEGFDAVHKLGSGLGGHRFDAVYLSLSAALHLAQTPGAWGQSLRRWVIEDLPLKLRPGGAAVYIEQPPVRHYTDLVERVARVAQCTSDALADALADAGVVLTPDTLAAPADAPSEIEDLTRPLEGTNDTPEPAPTVPFFVNGEQYDTTAGVRSGKALYDRVGDLSGQMLVAPDGSFVGDTDLVDIQGGETFATTPYRDPILRPEPEPSIVSVEVEDKALNVAVQAPEGHVVVMLNGIPKAVDPAQVKFVDDLWRVLQLAPASGLKVNKPGQVTRPLPDPNAAYKLEHGDAFESFLCERRLSRAAPVQITVDGAHRLLTPGVYTRAEVDVLFGCGGWVLSKNGVEIGSGNAITVERGDVFTTDIPF